MPYASDQQRKWAHTKSGMEALGAKKVAEFDRASKGKDLPKKVRKEGEGNPATTPPLDNLQFWVVTVPPSHTEPMDRVMTQADPFQFCQMHMNGLSPDQVAGFYSSEEEARKKAEGMLDELYDKAKALEEKKAEVATKLQKTIDELQKRAESHMKMMKSEPELAEDHHAKAERYMARLKELRGTHKRVEESKQELGEVSYKASGLEHPEKADLDDNKDLSKYELKKGKAIEKSQEKQKK